MMISKKFISISCAAILLTSCGEHKSPVTNEKSAADAIVAFYKDAPRHWRFNLEYFSANAEPFRMTGNCSIYYENDTMSYRVSVDSAITAGQATFFGTDVVRLKRFIGVNYRSDSTFEDLSEDPEQLEGIIGSVQPDFVFRPDSFVAQFNRPARVQTQVDENPGKDYYSISYRDTNSRADEMLTRTYFSSTYQVAKNDHRVLNYRYTFSYAVDGVAMTDSARMSFVYADAPEEEIRKKVLAFVRFKTAPPQQEIQAQDTVSVFPTFALPDEQLKVYSSSQVRSRYTLVELWYRGCLPCMKNLKQLNTVRAAVQPELLDIVAINDLDSLDDDNRAFLKRFDPHYHTLFNGAELSEALGVTAHPATYIYDTKTRKVVHTIKGSSETYADEIIAFVKTAAKK